MKIMMHPLSKITEYEKYKDEFGSRQNIPGKCKKRMLKGNEIR